MKLRHGPDRADDAMHVKILPCSRLTHVKSPTLHIQPFAGKNHSLKHQIIAIQRSLLMKEEPARHT